jgi:hypothetical protein
MTGPQLADLLADLQKQKADLMAERAEIRRQWLCERKATPAAVRAELEADLTAVAAEIKTVELELGNVAERYRKAKAAQEAEKLARLERWQWSDQMLAALQHVCESHGHHEYILTARSMANNGWPNGMDEGRRTQKIETTTAAL